MVDTGSESYSAKGGKVTAFLCFLGGCLLGGVYVALLWGTVLKMPKIRRKGLWLAGSVFVRLVVVFLGLIQKYKKEMGRFTWAFAGFLLVRFCAITYEKKKIQALLKDYHG